MRKFTFGTVHKDWPAIPMPELVFFQEGPGLRKWQWTDSGMKVINVTNILADGSFDPSNTSRYISKSEFEQKYRHFAVDAEDVVVASSGNTYGKVGRVKAQHLPLMMNTSVVRFRPHTGAALDPGYLYGYLRSPFFRSQVEAFVTGSAQPNFGPTHIKQMLLVAPPMPEQRRIAFVLSAYDNLIENNTRRIAILEEMARRIYEEWFACFRFPGHEGVRMVQVELGLVPEGWASETLGELVEFQKGKKPAAVFADWAPGRAPALLIDSLRGGEVEFAEADRLVPVSRSDTIMVMDGSGSAQVFIGHEGVIGSTLGRYRVSADAPVGAFWLYLFLLTNQSDIGGKNVGAAIPHANKDYIRSMPVSVPPREVAARFEDVVEPMFDLIRNLRAKNSTLRATRDLLLPKLISGELDVSAAPEPDALAA